MNINPMELLKNFQNIQSRISEMQEKLKDITVTGSSGGGMVKIVMDCRLTVRKVEIAKEVVDPEDVEMMQDLVMAAMSDALTKVQEKLREEASSVTGGMPIPPRAHGDLGRDRALNVVERLIHHFSRLPGLGRKSASRIVYFLLRADRTLSEDLARDIVELKSSIEPCRICGNYTDTQPCPICSDARRDRKSLCVVEEAKDILSIESIQDYRGLYHVLQGVISPLDGVGPEQLRIPSLLSRIQAEKIEEVILAMNPTVEGDTTALYLVDLLRKRASTRITRLALGLPAGGDLEYADRLTLSRAFRGRGEV